MDLKKELLRAQILNTEKGRTKLKKNIVISGKLMNRDQIFRGSRDVQDIIKGKITGGGKKVV
jgi:hypothetical protein